jgi:hypothetical protein
VWVCAVSVPRFLGVIWGSFWVCVGLRLLFGCGWFGFGSLLWWVVGLWLWEHVGGFFLRCVCGFIPEGWVEKVGCSEVCLFVFSLCLVSLSC